MQMTLLQINSDSNNNNYYHNDMKLLLVVLEPQVQVKSEATV